MSKSPRQLFGGLLLICLDVFAEGSAAPSVAKQSASILSYADVLQWLFALLLVLALFAGLVWLLRKTGTLPSTNKAQLAVVAGLSLGMRERLVLIKVGEKQLLLGITPGRMEKLLVLEGDQRLYHDQNNDADFVTFAEKLRVVMQGKINV